MKTQMHTLFGASVLLFSAAASSAQVVIPVNPQLAPQAVARVQAVFGAGQAQAGNRGSVDLEVIVTDWKGAAGVSLIPITDFHVYFAGSYYTQGCASEDSMTIESLKPGNNGIYALRLGFAARCAGWLSAGKFLAGVRIDTPATAGRAGYTGQTVARLEVQ